MEVNCSVYPNVRKVEKYFKNSALGPGTLMLGWLYHGDPPAQQGGSSRVKLENARDKDFAVRGVVCKFGAVPLVMGDGPWQKVRSHIKGKRRSYG